MMSVLSGNGPPPSTSSIITTLDNPKRHFSKVEISCENPDSTLCSFYLIKKRRFCRTTRRPGSRFCHTHCLRPDPTSFDEAGSQDGKVVADASINTEAPWDAAKAIHTRNNSSMLRVRCPINPNHTVYQSRLEKHIHICPDLRFVNKGLPYFCENYHANSSSHFAPAVSAGCEAEELDSAQTIVLEKDPTRNHMHRNLSKEELESFISRVKDCYIKFIEPEIVVLGEQSKTCYAPEIEIHSMIDTSLQQSKKHAPQHQGILRCLGDAVTKFCHEHGWKKLQGPPEKSFRCLEGFLEFGAGKGSLSVALQQVLVRYITLKERPSSEGLPSAATLAALFPFLRYVSPRPVIGVVDMGSFRRKGDARVSHSKIPLCRVRINLKDLDLTEAFVSNVFTVAGPKSRHGLGCSKSGYSDEILQKELGENALTRTATNPEVSDWAVLGKHLCGACTDFALSCITEKELGTRAHVRIWLVVLATCCHHRCELKHLNPVSCVPVSGETTRPSSDAILQLPGTDFAVTAREFACLASMSSWAVSGSFVEESRRRVGYYCKRILDSFRVSHLRQQGFSAWLCQYTERAVTEENVCIVAYKND